MKTDKMLYLIPALLIVGSFCLGISCIMLTVDMVNNGTVNPKSIAVGLAGLAVLVGSFCLYHNGGKKDKMSDKMSDPIPVPMLGSFCLGASCIMLLTDINNGVVSPNSIAAGLMGLTFLIAGLYVLYNKNYNGDKGDGES